MKPSLSPSSLGNIPIRVLLIDHLDMIRAGLRLLIEADPDIKIVGEAATYPDALTIASREKPDVILLDLIMGNENGLDYIPKFMNVSSHSGIIILTALQDPDVHQRAVEFGAMGLVGKEKSPETLILAIKKVHQGEVWLNRTLIGNLLKGRSRERQSWNADAVQVQIRDLTKREREIIKLVATGKKNKQIAETLSISDITVRHHLTSIFNKLALTDRFELIIYAYKHGLGDSTNVHNLPIRNR